MYAAKAAGKNAVRRFHRSMHDRAMERLELTAELPAAIDTGELELDYQPIVDLDSDEIVAVEALVRWRHPTRGRLGPQHFIEIAEQSARSATWGGSSCARRWSRAWSDCAHWASGLRSTTSGRGTRCWPTSSSSLWTSSR
jgi:predicted signal transduction protein with EAL and GGDEF domain